MRARNILVVTGVFLVDPQPLLCVALSAALEEQTDLEISGWSCDETETLELLAAASADVVITAAQLREGSGLSLIRRLRGRVPTILLAPSSDVRIVGDAIAAGAAGCLRRDCGLKMLAKATANAASGLFAIDQEHLRTTFRHISNPRSDASRAADVKLARLSGREKEVLTLLAEALDNEAIGSKLHLSGNTIRTHVGNILKKLEVHSRAEAVHLLLNAQKNEQNSQIFRITGPDLR